MNLIYKVPLAVIEFRDKVLVEPFVASVASLGNCWRLVRISGLVMHILSGIHTCTL